MKIFVSLMCLALNFATHTVLGQSLRDLIKGKSIQMADLEAKVNGGALPTKGPLTDVDGLVTKTILALVETSRPKAATGVYGLPPFDPFVVKEAHHMELKLADGTSGTLFLSNLIMHGLKDIIIEKLEYRLEGYRIDFSIILPNLTIDVDYAAKALIMDVVPYTPQGHIKLLVTNTKLNGAVSAKIVSDGPSEWFRLKALNVDVNIQLATAQVSGLLNGPASILEGTGMEVPLRPIIDQTTDRVAQQIAKIVVKEMNNVLSRVSVNDIMAILRV